MYKQLQLHYRTKGACLYLLLVQLFQLTQLFKKRFILRIIGIHFSLTFKV